MNYIIAQIIGAIAYSLLGYSFFRKNKKEILFVQILSYIGFSTHYYLMNAMTGMICNILGCIALILIYVFEKDEKKKKILVLILIPLLLLMGYFSYDNIFSLFPVVACLITFNSFLSKDENKIRFIGIISAVCWLVYAIIIKSYVAIVFEVILVISTIVAYVKNSGKKKGNKRKHK